MHICHARHYSTLRNVQLCCALLEIKREWERGGSIRQVWSACLRGSSGQLQVQLWPFIIVSGTKCQQHITLPAANDCVLVSRVAGSRHLRSTAPSQLTLCSTQHLQHSCLCLCWSSLQFTVWILASSNCVSTAVSTCLEIALLWSSWFALSAVEVFLRRPICAVGLNVDLIPPYSVIRYMRYRITLPR